MKHRACVLAGVVMLLLPQLAHARTNITVDRLNDPNDTAPQLIGGRSRSILIGDHPAIPESEPESECTGAVPQYPFEGGNTAGDGCLPAMDSFARRAHEFHRDEVIERRWWRLHRQRERRRIAAERRARREARRQAAAERRPTYISPAEVRPPKAAPMSVKKAIRAASEITNTPYIWGGGHASFESEGYDCSGAVSFALHGGGFLESPLDSIGLETWGAPGPGRWITVYTNAGHAWMTIAGLAFDTVGGPGPRWHPSLVDSPAGFIARHPPGY